MRTVVQENTELLVLSSVCTVECGRCRYNDPIVCTIQLFWYSSGISSVYQSTTHTQSLVLTVSPVCTTHTQSLVLTVSPVCTKVPHILSFGTHGTSSVYQSTTPPFTMDTPVDPNLVISDLYSQFTDTLAQLITNIGHTHTGR